MKVGMNLLLWTVSPTVKEHGALLQQIKSWGFDGVEFPVGGMADAEARALAKACDDLGLGRTAIFSMNAPEADPASPEPGLRAAAVDQMKRAIDLARLLGSDILTGPMFQGLGRFTGAPPTADEWSRAVEAIRQAAEHGAKTHVRLALEPLNRFEMYVVNTMADGSRFCRDVGLPNVGLLADTHHSNIEEPDAPAAWRRSFRDIFHVHISENDRGIPGRGHAAVPGIFLALHQGGFSGWCMIEAFSTKVKPLIPRLHIWRPFFEREEDVAVQGLRFIRESFQRAATA